MHPDYPVGVDAGKEESGKLGKEIERSFACGLERRLGVCFDDWKKANSGVSRSVLIAGSMMVHLQLIAAAPSTISTVLRSTPAQTLDYPV